MLYGLYSFGAVRFNPKTDIPSLTGKVILITGGNVGLGLETLEQLSHHTPQKIYLLTRTESKALSAIKEIQTSVPNAPVEFIQCDLTSLKSVQSAAREFVEKEKRLDLLYLNAGIMAVPPGQTKEGYEIQFGTNHMGHALLTKLLLPTLVKTAEEPGADVRVVSVSSVGHVMSNGVAFEDLKSDMVRYSTWRRYSQSKLCNILFTKELAKRYPSITSVAVHPGFVNTELYKSYFAGWGPLEWAAYKTKALVWTSVQEGAKGQLWAGTAAKKTENGKGSGVVSGEYYTPVGITGQGTHVSNDKVVAEKLWDWTTKELEGWEL